MSSTHLRLEGPDLPSLLDQVRAEYGPGARDRPRRADPPRRRRRVLRPRALPPRGRGARGRGRRGPRRAHGRPGGGPGHWAGAAHRPDRANRDGPRRAAEPGGARRPPAARRHARRGSPAAAAPLPGRPAAQPAPTLLAALTSTAAGGTAPMSTESASFADVLSRLQHSVAGAPAPVAMPVAGPGRRAGGGGGRAADLRPPGRGPVAGACCTGEALPRCRSSPWVASSPGSRATRGPRSRQPRSLPSSRASRPRDRLPRRAPPAGARCTSTRAPRWWHGRCGSACRHRSSRTPAMPPPSTGGCCPGWSPDRPHR